MLLLQGVASEVKNKCAQASCNERDRRKPFRTSVDLLVRVARLEGFGREATSYTNSILVPSKYIIT